MKLKLQPWNLFLLLLICSINVKAQSLILSSAVGTDAQTVCENTPLTTIEYTIGDGATNASITSGNLPPGVTGTFNAGMFTISGTPTGSLAAYTYTITTSGGANLAANLSGTITVIGPPTVNTTGSSTICSGELVPVSGASSSENTILWTHNGAGSLTSATTLTPTYISVPEDAGNTVILVLTSQNSCGETSSQYDININPLTTIALTGNTTLCEGEDLLVTSSVSSTNCVYQWTGMNSFSSTQANLSILNVQEVMSGTYELTVIDNLGCTNSQSIDVVVNLPVIPTLIYPDTVCLGNNTISLPITSIDTPIITGVYSPVFTTNTLGTTIYTFMPNAGQCATFTTMTVTIESCPDLVANVTPTTVSADGLCDGSASVNITSGTAPYTFLYSTGATQSDASSLCEGPQYVTITDANGYTITLNFIIPTPSNTTTTTNYLDSNLVDTVYNPAVTNCIVNYLQIDSAQITNYSILPNDSVSVTWSVYSAGTITTINDIYVLDPIAGIYMIALQIYCPQKTVGQFLVAYDQLYYNPAIVTINNQDLQQVSIAPNPFNDYIKISLENDQPSEIIITDIAGKIVFSSHYHSHMINLDLQSLSAGQYMLTIINGETIVTKHLVK